MPHQHTDSTDATSQNTVSDRSQPNDKGLQQSEAVRPEPASYAAADFRDATLAAPAAGEIGDYDDEGEPIDQSFGGSQQGRTNNDRELHAQHLGQGPKTSAANRRVVKAGRTD